MNIKCVITGQDKSGKSVIVRDTPVEPVSLALLPGYEFHRWWGSDSVPQLPTDGAPTPQPRYFPLPNGFRFGFVTIPPDATSSVEHIGTEGALAEIQQKLPGMMEVLEPKHPGMHTTDTVDFDVVVSGEVYLELDDGAEVLLKAGDCVIQNGTRHAWRNRSAQKCVIAFALIGAERKEA
jgi:mannose-6-phosphate isomerase-like protein (cupin superfamily)